MNEAADEQRPLVVGERLSVWAVSGVPEVVPGDDLAALGRSALLAASGLAPWDVVVVTHKVVSKAEGRLVALADVSPSPRALALADRLRQDPRMTEVVLRESRRVIRAELGVLITETHHGLICANAGVDRSNVGGGEVVTCLPQDPDRTAAQLRAAWIELAGGGPLGVVISDTFGRPFREGAANVAIGVAGLPALSDHRGLTDSSGYQLHVSVIASADEIAAMGEMVAGKVDARPLAVVRGLRWSGPEAGAEALIRSPSRDIFRW